MVISGAIRILSGRPHIATVSLLPISLVLIYPPKIHTAEISSLVELIEKLRVDFVDCLWSNAKPGCFEHRNEFGAVDKFDRQRSVSLGFSSCIRGECSCRDYDPFVSSS